MQSSCQCRGGGCFIQGGDHADIGQKSIPGGEDSQCKGPGAGVFEDQPGSQYGQSSKSKERYWGQKMQSLTGHYKKVTLTSHKVEETLAWF